MKYLLFFAPIFLFQTLAHSDQLQGVEAMNSFFQGSNDLDHIYHPYSEGFSEARKLLNSKSELGDKFKAAIDLLRSCDFVYVDSRISATTLEGENTYYSEKKQYSGIMSRSQFENAWRGAHTFISYDIGYIFSPEDFTNNQTLYVPFIFDHLKFLNDHGYVYDSNLNTYVPTETIIPECAAGLFS